MDTKRICDHLMGNLSYICCDLVQFWSRLDPRPQRRPFCFGDLGDVPQRHGVGFHRLRHDLGARRLICAGVSNITPLGASAKPGYRGLAE